MKTLHPYPNRLRSLLLILPASLALSGTLALAQVDFAARHDLSIGDIPQGIAIVDLNADGKKDIIVANSSSGTFSVLLGAGNGIFKPQTTKATLAYPEGLVVASDTR